MPKAKFRWRPDLLPNLLEIAALMGYMGISLPCVPNSSAIIMSKNKGTVRIHARTDFEQLTAISSWQLRRPRQHGNYDQNTQQPAASGRWQIKLVEDKISTATTTDSRPAAMSGTRESSKLDPSHISYPMQRSLISMSRTCTSASAGNLTLYRLRCSNTESSSPGHVHHLCISEQPEWAYDVCTHLAQKF